MAISPLQTPRFRLVFISCWFSASLVHLCMLYGYGFSWELAAWDSLVSNTFLFILALLVTVTLQFYIPAKNKSGYLLALCAILSFIFVLITKTVLVAILGSKPGYIDFFSKSIPVRMAIGFLMLGCTSLLSVLWYTIMDQREIEKRKTEADKLSKEAELYKLRQQLQPHFLFNSLNSINALIGSQPQKARTMIQQLSDFLRGTLKKEEHQWTSLDEELSHLQLYLEIEKVRFGHRLSTNVHNETTNMQIPAMLLQPVVENAIKFGLYDTTDDISISIEAGSGNNNLVIQVTNPFDPETSTASKGTGFGLSSVQRRLYLLFARNDLLKTDVRDHLFITTITIPQPHDQSIDNR